MLPPELRLIGIKGLPEISAGDMLPELLARGIRKNSIGLVSSDVLVVAQKVVSKSEGRVLELDSVSPGLVARQWAETHQKDARLVEVVLSQSRRIVRMDRGRIITETHHGFICANAGVDGSNAPPGTVVLLPENPDQSARELRAGLHRVLGVRLAVIVSDTFGRPWREGLTNVALGVAGLAPLVDYRGQADSFGRRLHATVVARADELAAAAELVMGKTRQIPAVIIKGLVADGTGSGQDLLRPPEYDLFR